jgi:hypothetical protein
MFNHGTMIQNSPVVAFNLDKINILYYIASVNKKQEIFMAAKKTKRPVKIGVFHILKSIVDYKMPTVHATIDAGRRAEDEGELIIDRIQNLESYIITNRSDPAEAREAEGLISDYRDQLCGIERKVMAAAEMSKQATAAKQFYQGYNKVVADHRAQVARLAAAAEIKELEARRKELESELDLLDDRIFNATINCDSSVRSQDLVNDSERDLEYLTTRCAEISNQLDLIKNKIQTYEK